MKENKFQKKVIEALKKRPVFIINLHGHLMQRAGLPDLEVIHHKWHGFLELKVENNKPSDIQKRVANQIKNKSVPIYVLRCVENIIERDSKSGFGKLRATFCTYTLEDFDGKVICEINDLDVLLDTLINLKCINEPEGYNGC